MSDIRGRFVWYENMTRDVQAAIGFYTAVTGWNTQSWTGMGEPYYMFANGDAMLAGLMKMPPEAEMPPHWMGYIGTPDVKATTARAEALGAKVWAKLMEIPTVGTFSVIQDPQGAFFAAYSPVNPPAGPAKWAEIGEFAWHELATTDVNGAWAFYSDLFGWEKKEAHDMGPAGIYQVFGFPSLGLGGIYKKPAEMPGPPNWMFYVRVANLEATVEKVTTNGGSITMEPHDVPGGGRIAMCLDPQGAAFALLGSSAGAAGG
jgi:predicted enzyme related to lactoylglutathione lyase